MTLQVTVVGLGVIGSSIGLGLKQSEGKFVVIGHDKDGDAAGRAFKGKCIDRTDWNLINACRGADIIVLSMPLAGVRDTLKAIAADIRPGCVVTDTANLKTPVLQWACESLPATAQFVGGHPILSNAASRPSAPAADLLAGATYCLTAAADTSPEALQAAADLAEAVGAVPFFLDAAEHDGLMAALEQAPLALATALQLMGGASPSRQELMRLAGPDFAGIAQLVAGNGQDAADAFTLNAANTARCLDILQRELETLRDWIANEDRDALLKAFEAASALREEWLKGETSQAAADYGAFGMMRMMFGDAFKPRKPEGE